MSSSSKIRYFSSLEVRQGVGALSISQDRGCLRLTSTHDFVAYCNYKTNALAIYGLANCKTFSAGGQRHFEYIAGSTKVIIDGVVTQVFENMIDRKDFTSPSRDLYLSGTRLRLSSLFLDGNVSLNYLDAGCIDTECNRGMIFNVHLSKTAALRYPLNPNCIIVKMHDESVISTYRMVDDQRYLWCVNNLILEIDGCKRIEGIEVLKALTVKAPGKQFINAAIHRSRTCVYKSSPTSLCIFDGPPPDPVVRTRSLRDEEYDFPFTDINDDEVLANLRNGFVVRAPARSRATQITITDDNIDDAPIDQAILDESRREYEADSTPPPPLPAEKHVPIGGNPSEAYKTTTKKGKQCAVCKDNKSTVVLSCGHRALCSPCAADYLSYSSKCPMCRKPITHVTALYDAL